jgi:phage baseplate assembly protein gpV
MAVRNRKDSEVARGEEDNGEEVERWKILRRRVGLHSGWRWSLERGAGDGRQWQNGSRGETRVTEEEEGRQESEGPLCKLKNFQGFLYKKRFPIDRKS